MSPILQSRNVPFEQGWEKAWYTGKARAEDRSNAGVRLRAPTRVTDDRAEGCSKSWWPSDLLTLSEVEKSAKLNAPTKLVWAMGSGFLDRFAVDMAAIGTPRVIRGRGIGGFDLVVEGFGVHDFGLADGFVVDSVR
jgi:hypothetical protein